MKYERPVSQSLAPFSSRINCSPSGFTYATTRGVYAGQRPERCVEGSFLALTGPGSVFECLIIALFSRSDVCSKPASNALYIADYMIALMWQSCNGERAASHTRGPWFWLYETPGEKRALGKCGGVAWVPGKALPFAPRSPLSKHQAHGHNSKTRPLRDYSTAVTRFLLLGASPCYETRA